MKITRFLFFVTLFFVSEFTFAQSDWNTHTSKDGKIEVKSRIDKLDDGSAIINYVVSSVGNFTLPEAEAFFKNSQNYKKFWQNCTESKEIEKTSESSWIAYLYFDQQWPIKDSDCVHDIKFSESDNEIKLSAEASPSLYKETGVQRAQQFDADFTVKPVNQQSSKIVLSVTFSSPSKAPKWLLSTWLPSGPIDIMEQLIKNIESN